MTRVAHRSHRRTHRPDRPAAEPADADGRAAAVGESFDRVAEGLLYALLTFAPLAYGTTQAWSREVFLLLVAAAAVTVAAKHVVLAATGRGPGYRWSWAYPLMLAFLGLAVAQVVPVPAAWLRAVSPGTVRLKTDLLADLPDAAAVLRRVTVSFYPHATVGQAVLVAAVSGLFAVVLDVFRDPARIRRLLAVIVGVGLVVAGVAAYQNLTGATTIYGLVQAGHRNAGPFANYSHFSQFINLSVGAALALLLDRLAELTEFYRTPAEVWAALRQPANAVVWACLLLCVAGPVVVLLSLSRMGMISMAIATVVTGGLLAWRGRSSTRGGGDGRAYLLVGLALAVFAVVLGVGFDVVSDRLATFRDPEAAAGRRDEMLRDMLVEFRQFPLLGTGLGTHEYVFGLYDHRDVPTRATHAENEYAQLMEETGVAGVALAGAFLAGLAVCYARATRDPADAIDYVPFGLGFGLVAILFHSGTDFGQHIPADAALTATFAALLTGLARRRRPVRPATPGRRGPRLVGDLSLAAVTVTAAIAVGFWADHARVAEADWATAQDRANVLEAAGWRGTDDDYVALLTPAAAASAREPADVFYRYWTDAYRWHAIARGADPATGTVTLPAEAVGFARQLADDLDGDRVLCPTYGPPLCIAGQIRRNVLGEPARGDAQIDAAYRLSPFDRQVCLVAGTTAALAHDWPRATVALDRYVILGGSPRDFADLCLHAGKPEIPYGLVRDDRDGLLDLANRMPADDPRWAAWIAHCRTRAARLLAAAAARPDAPPGVLAAQADLDRQQGRPADAVPLYQRALTADFGNLAWRLQLAHCLADAGRPADAVEQLHVCLRLHPGQPDAAALLADCELKAGGPTTSP